MTTQEQELIVSIDFAMNRKTANEVILILQNRDELMQALRDVLAAFPPSKYRSKTHLSPRLEQTIRTLLNWQSQKG